MAVARVDQAAVAGRPPPLAPPTPADAPTGPSATRRHVRPTAIGGATVALAVLSGLIWLGTEARAQVAVTVTLLCVLVLDGVVAARTLTGPTLRLRGPDGAVAGEVSEWVVEVEGARRPITVAPARLPRPRPLGVASSGPGRVTLAPFGVGVIHHLVVDVTSPGPVGLVIAARRVRVDLPRPVHVGPVPVPTEVEWPRPRALSFGAVEATPRGDEMFRSVRPYLRGDERRRIHWKATAHHGELMVREDDGAGVVALQVTVEVDRPGRSAELVAGVAAALVEEALHRGWVVHLVTLDVPQRARPPALLGSPFGPPPAPTAPVALPLRLRSDRVDDREAVNRQLATLGCGPVSPPPWSGMAFVISGRGVEWH